MEHNFVVGQRIVAKTRTYAVETTGYSNVAIAEGEEVEVTRVGRHRVLVRNIHASEHVRRSGWVSVEDFVPTDPNAPKPRKLGEAPEGMISANDPRLKWLWGDAAEHASKMGYCTTYDAICDALGIPGRNRKFIAVIKIGAVEMRGKYDCYSATEALELLRAELVASGVVIPEDATESARVTG